MTDKLDAALARVEKATKAMVRTAVEAERKICVQKVYDLLKANPRAKKEVKDALWYVIELLSHKK